jgi:hypothetical protein
MNKQKMNEVDNYLSLKRIVILSLAITVAYYSLYALSHYFGRPYFASSNDQELVGAKEDFIVDASKSVFGAFQQKFPGLFKGDRFQSGYKFKKPKIGIVMLFNVPFTFLIIFSVFLYNRKIMGMNFKWRRDELIVNIIGTLLIASLLSSLCTILQLYIWPHRPDPNRSMLGYISRGMLGDFLLVAIAFIFSYLQRSLYKEKKVAVENETLRAESIRSRYEALKNQLDPHFLFNSMNTLQSLITVDSDSAEEYVQQLSTVMRYTLQKREVVTLVEELKCAADYCRMLKMRYGDNLIFDHHIDHEKYDNHLVPPLAVQGLIENAIKHNVISAKQPLTIYISTDNDNHLIIKNKKQPKITEEEGTGIGLANLAERYRLQWDKKVEIFDDGNNFIVILPLVND